MSQENVEIVQRAWKAYRRRDNDAALALYDPEIEIDLRSEARVGSGVYHGIEGVQRWLRDLSVAFGELKSEVEEWIDADDQVIAMVRSYGRGRRSGVPVDMLEAHLWTVRDGKLRRLQTFATRAKALEAAGLRK
jgi:ketosteroid isomerase-like protein